jgi:tol-pal system protein YbgF
LRASCHRDHGARATARAPRRFQALACLGSAILITALSGCATKRDIHLLRTDLAAQQARQDSLFVASQRATRALNDSLHATAELLRTTRGQIANQIRQLQEMMLTVQELLGQGQQQVSALRQQLERQSQQLAAPTPDAGTPSATTSAEELYRLGSTKLQERSPAAARAAFQQLLAESPKDARAPDAQYGLAETYVLEQSLDRAVQEFERVAQLYPDSERAPAALYRAGVLSEERGNRSKAREYYQRVVNRYGNSPEARLARTKLARR